MNKIYNIFFVSIFIFCFLIVANNPSFGSENIYNLKINNDKTISVVGSGLIKERPNIALIDFDITLKNPDPSNAMDTLSQKANSLLQKIYEQGVNKNDIKTSNVSLQPIYVFDRNSNKEILDGYSATESFTLKTSVENSGKMISLLTNNGVNQINNIRFERLDINQLRLQAIEIAMSDARNQANAVLDKTKYRISGIKSVTVSPIFMQNPILKENLYNKSLTGTNQPLPIEGGEIEVRANVQVVFIFE
ncbi:hypothetical protein TDSAC_0939 [Thermodesulfobium acidiphilum]|uniref:DUF541 domain-containing protein n=1 Tax=Thermodesulfobium acidiphilum TaxID=1794699 RepID=A0A2R4W0G4_THEAF|nr:SIMPL domain-containing protein [Thermodesulfobium acidiphilum]AWB10293.1 hypothetical protein TDSAC_0939 [Thermodesulfobium acidiphilum]